MTKETPADVRALPKGTRLSDYRLERVLGHGGFGITYLATDLSLDQYVAIKEYYPREFAVRDRTKTVRATGNQDDRDNFTWGLDRFRDEARTLAKFSHPNVVAVRRLFEANGTSYIVMDFCEGEPLDQVIRRDAPLPKAQLEPLFAALLDGLEHVHAAGVMHRDIKPANIFIRSDGSPVLLDFGAARQALVNHSQSMTSLATAHYAAFEQYSTHGNQGPWTDIYGLAATCYHAATGEKPFDAPDRILEDKLPPLLVKAAGNYSRDFLQTIDAGLAVRPEDRPQSIPQWRNQLAVAGKRPMGTTPSGQDLAPPPDYKQAKIGIGISLGIVLLIGLAQFIGSHSSSAVEDPAAVGDMNAAVAAEGDVSDAPADAVTDAPTTEMSADLSAAVVQALKAQAAAKIAAQNSTCPAPEEAWDACDGTYAFDGYTYSGNWRNNEPSGYGVFTLTDGDRYEGEAQSGNYEGYGVYILKDGSRIEGQWSSDKRNGYARTLDAQENMMESGYYQDDKLR